MEMVQIIPSTEKLHWISLPLNPPNAKEISKHCFSAVLTVCDQEVKEHQIIKGKNLMGSVLQSIQTEKATLRETLQ